MKNFVTVHAYAVIKSCLIFVNKKSISSQAWFLYKYTVCGGSFMFEVNNGVAKIDGVKGKYNEENVTNPSVRYGRNSVQNFYSYLEKPIAEDNNATPPILDLGLNPDAAENNIALMDRYTKENDAYLKSLPPLEYEYRYMPNIHKKGEIDKDALMGAAYEELGRRKEVDVKALDKTFALDKDYSTSPMDINKDGKIDIGEYGTSILAADMISNNGNINGTINNKGHNALQELTKKANAEAAATLYGSLYNGFNLGNAASKFEP